MYGRAEAILFSALVVMLAAVTLAGATELAFPAAKAPAIVKHAQAPAAATTCTVARSERVPAG